MRRSPRHLLPLLLLCAALPAFAACGAEEPPGEAEGPITRVADMAEACADCTLDTRVVARIGTAEGDGALPRSPDGMARDGMGRYWLVYHRQTAMVFDADGAFLQTVGLTGAGPGEFQVPDHALRVADSIAIFDAGSGMHVYGPDLAWVRTAAMSRAQVQDATVMAWPTTVAVTHSPLQVRYGPRALLLDLSGERAVVRDTLILGEPFGPMTSDMESRSYLVAAAGDGSVWTTGAGTYRLVRRAADGTVLQGLRPESSWLPDGSSGLGGGPGNAPNARIADLWTDDRDRVWVLGHVAREDWREAWEGHALPEGGRGAVAAVPPSAVPPQHARYQTIVDVWDPAAGRLLVSRRYDGYANQMLDDGSLVVYTEEGVGYPVLEIVALTLEGGG